MIRPAQSEIVLKPPARRPARAVAAIVQFYRDGFRRMTVGKTLWKVIIIKLIIIFAVLKLFFFQGFLESKFKTDNQRAAYVLEQITQFAPATHVQQEER